MTRLPTSRRPTRQGTTAVEVAMVLPLLLIFFFAIVEFGHAYMTSQQIKSAAREAARLGVSDGQNTAAVVAEAKRLLAATMDPNKATIYVKDGGVFDSTGPPSGGTSSLPDVEVSELESRELFVVRIEVPYNSISLFPNGFWHTHMHNLTLSGQAVARHE